MQWTTACKQNPGDAEAKCKRYATCQPRIWCTQACDNTQYQVHAQAVPPLPVHMARKKDHTRNTNTGYDGAGAHGRRRPGGTRNAEHADNNHKPRGETTPGRLRGPRQPQEPGTRTRRTPPKLHPHGIQRAAGTDDPVAHQPLPLHCQHNRAPRGGDDRGGNNTTATGTRTRPSPITTYQLQRPRHRPNRKQHDTPLYPEPGPHGV